jgi:taurine dioxygenase
VTLAITPLKDTLGARVEGIDLHKPVADEAFDLIQQAFLDHQLLHFPGQTITSTDQISFCDRFGSADSGFKAPGRERPDDYRRGVMLVSNLRKDGKPIGSLPDGEMQFHSDGSHRQSPYLATTLYAIKIPGSGGDTVFADLYAAYDALSDETKAMIDDKQVLNVYYQDATHREEFEEGDALIRRATHPLAKVHPETGRKALFVNRLMSRHIVDMPETEGDALLAELVDHTERPEFIYAHQWAVDDFLMWDNRCVNHARTDFSETEERLLRRYTVSDVEAPATA